MRDHITSPRISGRGAGEFEKDIEPVPRDRRVDINQTYGEKNVLTPCHMYDMYVPELPPAGPENLSCCQVSPIFLGSRFTNKKNYFIRHIEQYSVCQFKNGFFARLHLNLEQDLKYIATEKYVHCMIM